MDCGDAGDILVSKHAADDLEQYPQWHSHLTELGEHEVKHGARVSVVNLYTDESGNAALPTRLAGRQPSPPGRRALRNKPLLIAGLVVLSLAVGIGWWDLRRIS
jgi:hypothetical protein